MELTKQQLYIMLGINPNIKEEDITIIIKNNKTNETLNTLGIDDLFQGIYNLPLDLSTV